MQGSIVTPRASGSDNALDVDALVAELTLEEKAALTSGSSFWYTAPVDRLGIPSLLLSDGPNGLRTQPGDHVDFTVSVPATCFPQACALASTWNPNLLYRVGSAIGQEARALKVAVVLGPGINMKRSPLCGRNFEYFSEDPYLAGELGVGIVSGIQSRGVGASVKHFAVNNQETNRSRVDAQVDERTLREIYLPAFERVIVGAQPWTVMCSYNKVNGVLASENAWLLTTVLREEFGFEGAVVSDWGAVLHRVPALAAGLDLEMPPALGRSPEEIVAAVESGELHVDLLDRSVRAVLRLAALGGGIGELDETFEVDAHHALARAAAAESIVLLKNEGVLPLRPDAAVAVVGELARTPRYQGSGSSRVTPTKVDVMLDELRAVYGDVPFAAGYALDSDDEDAEMMAEAREVAASAGTVVMVLGLRDSDETEGMDRAHMNLPANQLAALKAVAEVSDRVVVVLVNGSTVLLDRVTPYADALVESWLGGQAAGGAIVDVLTGRVNPSGRLAETIPLRLEDNASHLNFPGDELVVRYGEGVFIGYRGYDAIGTEVAFPFGFGLSYTTFALTGLRVTVRGSVADGSLQAQVHCVVTNTGATDGAEVVQVYVSDAEASVNRPDRELKGFTKVFLRAGEAQEITIDLDQRAFSYWSPTHSRWVVEAGAFTVAAGTSSRDLPLSATIHVDAPSVAEPLTAESTLKDWVANPIGRRLLEAETIDGKPLPVLAPALVDVHGSMSMRGLANFAGVSIDHDGLDRIAAEWAVLASAAAGPSASQARSND